MIGFSLKDKAASNIETFGHFEAAKIAKRQKIPFPIFYSLAFGKAPKTLQAPPCNSADLKLQDALRVAQYIAWLARVA